VKICLASELSLNVENTTSITCILVLYSTRNADLCRSGVTPHDGIRKALSKTFRVLCCEGGNYTGLDSDNVHTLVDASNEEAPQCGTIMIGNVVQASGLRKGRHAHRLNAIPMHCTAKIMCQHGSSTADDSRLRRRQLRLSVRRAA